MKKMVDGLEVLESGTAFCRVGQVLSFEMDNGRSLRVQFAKSGLTPGHVSTPHIRHQSSGDGFEIICMDLDHFPTAGTPHPIQICLAHGVPILFGFWAVTVGQGPRHLLVNYWWYKGTPPATNESEEDPG